MHRSHRLMVKSVLLSTAFSVASTAMAAKKTLVYCSEGSPSIFNPQLAEDGSTYNNTRAIYNRLVEFKIGETVIEPALAEKWDVSKDGLTYTFTLRKGVKWHASKTFTPTREFNADDVLFSFNRQRLKDHPFNKVNGGNYTYFDGMEMGKIIKDIQKVDNYTVKFILQQPEAPFLPDLAMDFASILSAEYAEQMTKANTKEKIDFEPIGTGPFKFKSYVKDQTVRYEAHEHFWKGRVKLDNLVFAITEDPGVRYQKLKTGECHFIAEPPTQDIPAMRKDKKLAVMELPGLNIAYLSMNVEKPPFDKKEVRLAIAHALNKASYIDAIYFGNARVAKNPIPPTMWSYDTKAKDSSYDPKKALELLKKAGYPNGFETDLWTMPVSRPYNPNGKKMGELMQADLAKVGIKVKLVTFDWPTYLEKSKKGEHQMLQMGWTGDNGDPDNFLNTLLSCSAVQAGANRSRWCHKPFNDLVEKARTISDVKERSKLYVKAQEIVNAEQPWISLAHSTVYRAMSSKVKGYKMDPFGGDHFDFVDIQ